MLVGSGKQRPGVQSLPNLHDNGECGGKNGTILGDKDSGEPEKHRKAKSTEILGQQETYA